MNAALIGVRKHTGWNEHEHLRVGGNNGSVNNGGGCCTERFPDVIVWNSHKTLCSRYYGHPLITRENTGSEGLSILPKVND